MLFELLIGTSEGIAEVSPEEEIIALVILAVIFILLYIFREKRRKNKYEPEKKRNPEDPNLVWGPLSGGKPIGPPS
jgi:uncharacterized membrane protein YhaH (DUF805 family)